VASKCDSSGGDAMGLIPGREIPRHSQHRPSPRCLIFIVDRLESEMPKRLVSHTSWCDCEEVSRNKFDHKSSELIH
jgi:hypothetical protein